MPSGILLGGRNCSLQGRPWTVGTLVGCGWAQTQRGTRRGCRHAKSGYILHPTDTGQPAARAGPGGHENLGVGCCCARSRPPVSSKQVNFLPSYILQSASPLINTLARQCPDTCVLSGTDTSACRRPEQHIKLTAGCATSVSSYSCASSLVGSNSPHYILLKLQMKLAIDKDMTGILTFAFSKPWHPANELAFRGLGLGGRAQVGNVPVPARPCTRKTRNASLVCMDSALGATNPSIFCRQLKGQFPRRDWNNKIRKAPWRESVQFFCVSASEDSAPAYMRVCFLTSND